MCIIHENQAACIQFGYVSMFKKCIMNIYLQNDPQIPKIQIQSVQVVLYNTEPCVRLHSNGPSHSSQVIPEHIYTLPIIQS